MLGVSIWAPRAQLFGKQLAQIGHVILAGPSQMKLLLFGKHGFPFCRARTLTRYVFKYGLFDVLPACFP
jgi:hypothetical protein